MLSSEKSRRNLSAFYAKNPAVIPIVVGRLAAQTFSFLIRCSLLSMTASEVTLVCSISFAYFVKEINIFKVKIIEKNQKKC